MKKIISIVLVLALALTATFALVACDSEEYVVAMITDSGDITDESFNQSTWEAVVDWATENGYTYAYYKPVEDTTDARVAKIEEAINAGAEIVVTPGYLFEDAIYEVQYDYPDVNFVLLDGEPHTSDYTTYDTEDNVTCILFQEEIAGYVAGYAAVMEGQYNLGFMGGSAVPAVQRFGVGFIQGASDAATIENVDINLWYGYAGVFVADAGITTVVDTWLSAGCTTIFACGGGIWSSVADSMIAASNASGLSLIGVDSDQSLAINATTAYANLNVMTSAMKDLYFATQTTLEIWAAGDWDDISGITLTYGISADDLNDYVGLPTATTSWNFTSFSTTEYTALIADIRDGDVVVSSDYALDIEKGVGVTVYTNVTVKYYNASVLG